MKINHIVVPDVNRVELLEAEIGERLGEEDILIETEATFISPGTELAIFQAKTERVYQPDAWCAYPWIAGYANVGTILQTGDKVKTLQAGQRVFTHGVHASAIIVRQDQLIVPVPAGLDAGIAAASRLASISATALHVTDVPINAWVAVYGLGIIGNLAAQIYRLMGCGVIGIDPNNSRRSLASRCGIGHTVGGSSEEVLAQIGEITNGRMCDISVDAVGHSTVVGQALKSTANEGQVVLLGTPRVPVEGNITDILADVHLRRIALRGALNFIDPKRLLNIQRTTFDWIDTGRLLLGPLISHRMPPEHIEQAYKGLLLKQEEYTGIVLQWKPQTGSVL